MSDELQLRVKEIWPGQWGYWVGSADTEFEVGNWGPHNTYPSRRKAIKKGRKELRRRRAMQEHQAEWQVVE